MNKTSNITKKGDQNEEPFYALKKEKSC